MRIIREPSEAQGTVFYTIEKHGHPAAKLQFHYTKYLSADEFDLIVALVNLALSK